MVGKPDFIFVMIELFRYILRLRRYKRKSVKVGVFWRGGSLWAQILDGRGRHPLTTVSVRKVKWLPFRVVWKYPQYIVWFCQKARVWQTNRQTDRRTDRHLIPRWHSCSRCKNEKISEKTQDKWLRIVGESKTRNHIVMKVYSGLISQL